MTHKEDALRALGQAESAFRELRAMVECWDVPADDIFDQACSVEAWLDGVKAAVWDDRPESRIVPGSPQETPEEAA